MSKENLEETIELMQELIDKQQKTIESANMLLHLKESIIELQDEERNIVLEQNKTLKRGLLVSLILFVTTVTLLIYA
jgi:hypothetical protein